ncbi:hypothetical protein ISCGN_015232, partial [Ixodes scapularis]
QLQIEELSRRLRTEDLGIPYNPEERSPSPEPIYNSAGKRLNTREYRVRKRLEDERHMHITEMFTINPDYKPPSDYKPPLIRVSEKVMIPQEEHPDINFVGLLIGPRGNTLKSLEKETGAKIIIRGKGSVKEGKVGRKDGQPLPGEDEPLHAFVTASNQDNVRKAVDRCRGGRLPLLDIRNIANMPAMTAAPPVVSMLPSWASQDENSNTSLGSQENSERRRKRRSRWCCDEKEKVFIPGMPTVLPTNLDPNQERAYL